MLFRAVADGMAEIVRLRERLEEFVVPELNRQAELLARVVAGAEGAGMLGPVTPSQSEQPGTGAADG